MRKKAPKPTTVRLEPEDKEAIERIKTLYGCPSEIAAIRLALRMVARGEHPQRDYPPQAPTKEAAFPPVP